MQILADTQRDFLRALLSEDAGNAGFHACVRTEGVSAAARVDVYRNNVFSNYRAALQAVYPVIERLVGEQFFRHACNRYIADYASDSGDLHDYGASFAQFLQAYPHASELPYLPDVARLEWLYHRVFHAAEHAPLDLARLAAIDPAQYGTLRFSLHPACALMQSPFPVLRIWQVNQPDYAGEISVDWNAGADDLLVSREANFSVKIEKLPRAEYAFLAALANGGDLASALESGLALEAEFDLQLALVKGVQTGAIVDFAA